MASLDHCYESMEKMFPFLDKHLKVSMLVYYSMVDTTLASKTIEKLKSTDLEYVYRDFYNKFSTEKITDKGENEIKNYSNKHEIDVSIISDALRENKVDDPSLYVVYYREKMLEYALLSDDGQVDVNSVSTLSDSDIVFKIFECAMLDYETGNYERASELFLLYSQLSNNSSLVLKANFYELSARIISQNTSGIVAIVDIIHSKIEKFSGTYYSDHIISLESYINSNDFNETYIYMWNRFLHLTLLSASLVNAGYNNIVNHFYNNKTGFFYISNFSPHLLKYLVISTILSRYNTCENIFTLACTIKNLIITSKENFVDNTDIELKINSIKSKNQNWMNDPIIIFFLETFYDFNFNNSSNFEKCFSVIAKDYVLCNWTIIFIESVVLLMIKMRIKLFGKVNLEFYKNFLESLSKLLLENEITCDNESAINTLSEIYSRIFIEIQKDLTIMFDDKTKFLEVSQNEAEQTIYSMNFKIHRIRNFSKELTSDTMND